MAKTLVILIVGIALGGVGAALIQRASRTDGAHDAAAHKGEVWTCPMHPQYTSDHPGDCPICGMKLVKLEALPPAAAAAPVPTGREVQGLAAVQIDGQRQQLIGLRTAPVEAGTVSDEWRTVGRVVVDETRIHKINVKVDGFVERLFVDYVGKPVRRGQPLLSIYSPELLSVQNELLLALKTRSALGQGGALASSGDDLVAAARRRLELWDVPDAEIDALARSGKARRALTLRSPWSGIVTAKSVVAGSKVTAGDTPFEVTDLSEVWVVADAHESDLSRVRLGATAGLTLAALPNRVFTGRVSFVDPVLDARTRTAKVRLVFRNPRDELRPEMFGEVTFHTAARRGLTVPADAVIDSGERKVVFVAMGDGRFEPREIETGHATGDRAEVLSGLREGERVVVRANFLVDSESRLKAALASLGSKAPPGHVGHGGAVPAAPAGHEGHGAPAPAPAPPTGHEGHGAPAPAPPTGHEGHGGAR